MSELKLWGNPYYSLPERLEFAVAEIAVLTKELNRRAPEAGQLSKAERDVLARQVVYGPTGLPDPNAGVKQIMEMLAAEHELESCPECGNEERHPRTGLFTCECPAPLPAKTQAQAEPIPADLTDDRLREIWRHKGGNFHGPRIETGTMPEVLLLKYLRSLYTHSQQPAVKTGAPSLNAPIAETQKAGAIADVSREQPAEPQEPVVSEAMEAMNRAKLLPVWDSIPYALHVEIDAIFKCIIALSAQTQRPAVPDLLKSLDSIFEQEIARVSELEYNSNKICRKFYSELRKHLAAAPGMGE